jgi:hypothetical protein
MTEPESVTQAHAGSETNRGKGKAKAAIKRSKSETPREQPEQVSGGRRPDRPTEPAESREAHSQDPLVIARIQERAYGLFVDRGCEHGHALEHWLEAERQITGSPER